MLWPFLDGSDHMSSKTSMSSQSCAEVTCLSRAGAGGARENERDERASAGGACAADAMAAAAAATATEFSSEKLSLAMIILGEQFGNIVKAVGATMVRRGQMTLTDLVRYVDMPGQKRRLGEPGALSAESSRNRRLEAQRERLHGRRGKPKRNERRCRCGFCGEQPPSVSTD